MENIENNLGKVAGGKAVESKDGKFFVVEDDALMFDTEAEAKAADRMRTHLIDKMSKHKEPKHGGILSRPIFVGGCGVSSGLPSLKDGTTSQKGNKE